MKVTINDVARAANVSKSTVSKVLNNASTIPEATKEKIRSIMKELNYTPSSMATQLARQSSLTIGFIMDADHKKDFINPFAFNIISGAESVTYARGYELTISNSTSYDADFMNRYVWNRKLDGLLIHMSFITQPMIEQLEELRFPYVILGQPSWEDAEREASWIDFDNELAGKLAAEHLMEQGFQRIAFIGGMPHEPISTRRIEGYSSVVAGTSKTECIQYETPDEQGGYQAMVSLLAAEQPPDAVICVNNLSAFGAMNAVKEQGLSIPGDVGFVTFDNYPLAPYLTPALTAIDLDMFKLGVTACNLLFERIGSIEQANSLPRKDLLHPELRIRASSRKAKHEQAPEA